MFIGIAGVSGFTHFATKLLVASGATGYLSHPTLTLFALCVVAAWFLAYKDITFSTILMLIFEESLRHCHSDVGISRAGQDGRRRHRAVAPCGQSRA